MTAPGERTDGGVQDVEVEKLLVVIKSIPTYKPIGGNVPRWANAATLPRVRALAAALESARADNEALRVELAEWGRVGAESAHAKIALLRQRQQLTAERDAERAKVQAVEAIHRPRTATVYSSVHHDADHDTEDDRCTDACFEPWELCDGCGGHWPCSTAAVLAAAQPTGKTP